MESVKVLEGDVLKDVEMELNSLIDSGTGIYAALYSTIDGHAVIHATKQALPESKFAAMTSSLIALGESVAREGTQSACQYVVIVNSDGVVVPKRCGKFHVLTVLARKDTNLGMVLSASRASINRILALTE